MNELRKAVSEEHGVYICPKPYALNLTKLLANH